MPLLPRYQTSWTNSSSFSSVLSQVAVTAQVKFSLTWNTSSGSFQEHLREDFVLADNQVAEIPSEEPDPFVVTTDHHNPNMTDSSLSEDAKKLLDDLANALPGIKYQEDPKGNREYEHEGVKPFVKPLLAAIGLKV